MTAHRAGFSYGNGISLIRALRLRAGAAHSRPQSRLANQFQAQPGLGDEGIAVKLDRVTQAIGGVRFLRWLAGRKAGRGAIEEEKDNLAVGRSYLDGRRAGNLRG